MKKTLAFVMSLFTAAGLSPAQAAETAAAAPKTLIVYYSLSGNTRKVAEEIQKLTGGDIFAIQTEETYPEDYSSLTALVKEQIKENYRPKLKDNVKNLAQYDVVFLGSPNWWGTIAPAVSSFLAANDLSGKTVIPFITHGSGGVQNTVKTITEQCRGCKISSDPWVVQGAGISGLQNWLKKVGAAG